MVRLRFLQLFLGTPTLIASTTNWSARDMLASHQRSLSLTLRPLPRRQPAQHPEGGICSTLSLLVGTR